MNISLTDIFLEQKCFINKKIREISNIDSRFFTHRKYLEEQFKDCTSLASQTDASFSRFAVKLQDGKANC